LKQLAQKKRFFIKPAVLIQPMAMLENGLSEVEERLFQELAYGLGARVAKVWVGHELSEQEVITRVKSE